MIPRNQLPSYDHLAGLMSRYTTEGLVHDLSIRFHWEHAPPG